MLTLSEVLPYFNNRKALLADQLNISRQAVSNWKLDQPIPAKHELRLRMEILPQLQKAEPLEPDSLPELNPKLQTSSNPAVTHAGELSSFNQVATDNQPLRKSKKLDNVLYEIRGPVLEEAYRLEEDGHRILKLNVGNPGAFDLHAPDEILHDVIHNLGSAEGYCESRGLFPARKAIMQESQIRGIPDVGINDIFMGNGVSELIVLCMQALINDGDEILIPSPDYPLWTAAVRLSGGKAIHYRCDEQSDWAPDLSDIEAKITSNTRALVVINPNNPTGAVYEKDLLERLGNIATKHNLILFADEIYDKIVYDTTKHYPLASLVTDTLVITLNGLSKSYRLAGFRSGWMILSGARQRAKDFIEGLLMLCSIRLCANVPGQLAVQTALGGYQSIRDLVHPGGRLAQQRDLAWSCLDAIPGVSCVKPKGALYLFPRLDPKVYRVDDDEQLVLDLLTSKHLLLVQGTAFNWPDHDHLRLVFLPRAEELQSAIDKLEGFLKKIPPLTKTIQQIVDFHSGGCKARQKRPESDVYCNK